eukprot:IDg4045t1
MKSITALAHLRAAVSYFIDPSEGGRLHPAEAALADPEHDATLCEQPIVVEANKRSLGWESGLGEK